MSQTAVARSGARAVVVGVTPVPTAPARRLFPAVRRLTAAAPGGPGARRRQVPVPDTGGVAHDRLLHAARAVLVVESQADPGPARH